MARFGAFAPRSGTGGLDVHTSNVSALAGGRGAPQAFVPNASGPAAFQPNTYTPPIAVPPSQIPSAADGTNGLRPDQITQLQLGLARAKQQSTQIGGSTYLEAYRQATMRKFEQQNLPAGVRSDVRDLLYERGKFDMPRHRSPLTMIARGMAVIESAGAGFGKAYGRTATGAKTDQGGVEGRITKPGDLWHALTPWAQYHAIGAGFSEIPKAVGEGYTYADMLKESSKPGTFTYKYSQPIGISMSVLYDPLTYTSFGTGTIGRHAAYEIMASQHLEATTAARLSIEAGNYGGDMNRLHEAVMEAKVARGHAMTMGDALDQVRNTALTVKQEIRKTGGIIDPSTGEVMPVGKMTKVGAWAAPMKAPGGRGMRVLGGRVPGTGEMGVLTAKGLRTMAQDKGAAGNFARGMGMMFVPDWAARHVQGDALRASLLVEMAKQKAEKQALMATIGREVRTMQQVKHYPGVDQAERTAVEHDLQIAGVKPTVSTEDAPSVAHAARTLKTEEGPPGITIEDGHLHSFGADTPAEKKIVYRDEKGKPQGILTLHLGMPDDAYNIPLGHPDAAKVEYGAPEVVSIAVNPSHQRQGIATALYQKAREAGYDVDAARHEQAYTEAGAAFTKARLTEQQRAEVNAVAKGHDVLKVSEAQRKDLLRENYDNLPAGPLKNLHHNINEEAKFYIEKAVGKGASRDELENRWTYMSQHGYHDPLAALYDFKVVAETKVQASDFTKRMLEDARFSLPMYSGTEKKAIEKAVIEKPLITRGPLRPVHIGTRSVVTTADGVEHTMPQISASDFVAGAIHDSEGNILNVDEISQVRDHHGQLIWREPGFVAKGPGMKLLHDVPAGYKVYTHGSKRYAVVDAMHDALRTINNPVDQHLTAKKIFGVVNAPQNWWKVYATSPNPAFHVMNLLGALWNNQLAGVYNPMDYAKAASVLYQGRKEEAAQAGERFWGSLFDLGKVPESTAKGKAAQQTLQELENRGGGGRSSFLFADISRGVGELTKEMQADVGQIGKKRTVLGSETLGKTLLPDEGTSLAKTVRFYTTKRGRQVTGAALAGTGNPLGLFLLAPEAARVGQRVTGNIENVVRLAPFMKHSNDPILRQIIHRAGPISVDGMTHPRWSKAEQQVMYDIGARITSHFQFDYTNLTDFERYVAKTFFPFWSYYKKNFVLQATELAKQPRKYEAAVRLMNYMNSQGQDFGGYAPVLPQYFDNIAAFQVPVPNYARGKLGLPKDQPLFLNPKMPFLSLNMVPPLWDMINDPHETTSQKFLETIAPVAGSIGPLSVGGGKILLEAGTGHNLGLNRPIDYQRVSSNDYRQSYVDAPSWAKYMPHPLRRFMGIFPSSKKNNKLIMSATSQYILEQMTTPFINNLGQTIPVGGSTDNDKSKARADMVSWMTGVRLIPVDVLRLSRNQAYTMKNILEAKQSELRQQGKELSDSDATILRDTKMDLDSINRAWDDREGINR